MYVTWNGFSLLNLPAHSVVISLSNVIKTYLKRNEKHKRWLKYIFERPNANVCTKILSFSLTAIFPIEINHQPVWFWQLYANMRWKKNCYLLSRLLLSVATSFTSGKTENNMENNSRNFLILKKTRKFDVKEEDLLRLGSNLANKQQTILFSSFQENIQKIQLWNVQHFD